MPAKLLIATSAILFAASIVMAAAQPPAHTGHFKPVVSEVPPPGPDGGLGMAILSAAVNGDASIDRGAGVTGAIHLAAGAYEVDFDRDVLKCTYVVSIGQLSTAEIQGQADVQPRSDTLGGLFVETWDLGSTDRVDKPFYIIVFCAK